MVVSKENLSTLARAIVWFASTHKQKGRAFVLALVGDLGAGKTALVQHLAKSLEVVEVPPSPTFVLMKNYRTKSEDFKKLVHIDAYRIENKAELPPLHLERVFADDGAFVCVEWPERLFDLLPKEAFKISLISLSETQRELKVEGELGDYLQKYI